MPPKDLKKQWIKMVNLVIFILGVLICIFLIAFGDSPQSISFAICLWAGIQIVFVTLWLCIGFDRYEEWHWGEDAIISMRNMHRNKVIHYADIKAIVICFAVDSHFFPIYNKQGVKEVAIAVYDEICKIKNSIHPDRYIVVPIVPLEDVLGCTLFSQEMLRILWENTQATVFMTQGAYDIHSNEIDALFSKCTNKVFVSIQDGFEHKLLTFDEFRTTRRFA